MDTTQVWAEIDLTAIAANVRALKSLIGPDCTLMAVVKANGYGHGMVEVAQTALANGAGALGVARVEEALTLRRQGVAAPVLVLGYTPPDYFSELLDFDIAAAICDYDQAVALSALAEADGRRIRSHINIDTGMGRLGIVAGSNDGVNPDSLRDVCALGELSGLQLEGLYTHFATADEADKSAAEAQYSLFQSFLNALTERDEAHAFDPWALTCHAANSAALIDMPETHLGMVRAGIAIYGLYPSAEVDRQKLALTPAMSLKTRIVQLKQVPAGFSVSYGATYKTCRPTTLAVVPAGYADGYSRHFSSSGHMLVAGQKVPVVGRVCMDLTVLDVGEVPSVAVGDEVVIFGTQGDAHIPVDDLADQLGTINYEVVSTVTDRVPRIYFR